MIPIASVWVAACVCLLPDIHASLTTKSGNLFSTKLSKLLDDEHRSTLHGGNLHEARLSSLLRDGTRRHETPTSEGRTPVLYGTPITQRRTKFPPWHLMHDYSNETFEGQTVNYDTWRRPPPSSKEIVEAFRKKYPRDQRPRYTKYNFTEIGSIFEQAFIDGELHSADYDYLRVAVKRNMSGIQITRSPFDYLTTRERKLKPWKRTSDYYIIDTDYYNEIMGINATWPAWVSTPVNKQDDEMIQAWMMQQNY